MRFTVVLFLFLSTQLLAGEWTLVKGIQFHQSCLQERASYPQVFHQGIEAGLSCLNSLGTIKSKEHVQLLTKVLSSNFLKVGCHEMNYRWERASANSSTGPEHNIPALGLLHPFISFKPRSTHTNEFLSQVSFHEVFHNIGYHHGSDVDYAYACEECCFTEDEDLKAAACKVCKSSYTSIASSDYLIDLQKFESLSKYRQALQVPKTLRKAFFQGESLSLRESILSSDQHDQPLSIMLAKRWQYLGSSVFLNVAQIPLAPDTIPYRKSFGRITEGRMLMFEAKDFPAAADMFLQVDTADLGAYLIADRTRGLKVIKTWNSDLDELLYQLSLIRSPLMRPIEGLIRQIEKIR